MDDHAIVALYWARDERALTETAAKFGAYCRKIGHEPAGQPARRRGSGERHLAGRLGQHAGEPPGTAGPLPGAYHPQPGAGPAGTKPRRKSAAAGRRRFCWTSWAECLPAPDRVEQEVEAAELARQISAFLRAQPEPARSMFLRRYWYGDAIGEIAVRYGMPTGRVRVTLHRTRARLRQALEREGVTV